MRASSLAVEQFVFMNIYSRIFSCFALFGVECFHTFFNKFLCSWKERKNNNPALFVEKFPQKTLLLWWTIQLIILPSPTREEQASVGQHQHQQCFHRLQNITFFPRFFVVNCLNRRGTWKIERAQMNNMLRFVAVRLSWHVKNHEPLRFTAANVLLIKDFADGSLAVFFPSVSAHPRNNVSVEFNSASTATENDFSSRSSIAAWAMTLYAKGIWRNIYYYFALHLNSRDFSLFQRAEMVLRVAKIRCER